MIHLGNQKITGFESNGGIAVATTCNNLAVSGEVAAHKVEEVPVVQRIPSHGLRRKPACKAFLVVETVKSETAAGAAVVLVGGHIGNLPRRHHEHYIGAIVHTLVAHIAVGVLYPLHIGRRNNVGAEHKCCRGYYRSRYQIGAQQSPEAHAGREHGYELAVASQFGGEEYYGNESEQRRKLVGEIRKEIHEIVHHRGLQRCLQKGVEFLVDIEHNHYCQQQNDGKNVSSQELTDYVPVENLEHFLSDAR